MTLTSIKIENQFFWELSNDLITAGQNVKARNNCSKIFGGWSNPTIFSRLISFWPVVDSGTTARLQKSLNSFLASWLIPKFFFHKTATPLKVKFYSHF
jgi:hypothetical protein